MKDIESLVYTVDVQVGCMIWRWLLYITWLIAFLAQRFNLTLDTDVQVAVLFAKGFVASNRSCSTGDAKRNLFDRKYVQALKQGFLHTQL